MTNLLANIQNEVRESNGLFSVLDVIKVCGVKDQYKAWERIKTRYPSILSKTTKNQFLRKDGRGKTKATDAATPVVLLEIIGVLPGVIGRKYRAEAAQLMHQFLTDKAGLAEALVEQIDDVDDLKRIKKRTDGKLARHSFTGVIDKNLPSADKKEKGFAMAICTNKIYEGLFGGKAKDLKEERGLAKKESLRDSMSYQELVALEFAEMIAGNSIDDGTHVDNKSKMGATSFDKATAVKKLI